ncbi:hypothetical protein BIY29_17635 [Brenneria alni]|uniref:Uncharacterized protein n=2 Tax=Brenneria alni TaxID=71656 RepID=A0A421DJV1_9GAMM|nr:hypothetical protein BIY29_17635 [Brenneria alni]
MAFAAFKAYKTAKKYLGEFFAKEGYKLAISLVNENLMYLGINKKLLILSGECLVIYGNMHDNSYGKLNEVKLMETISRLDEALKINSEYLQRGRDLSFQMETYGIYA